MATSALNAALRQQQHSRINNHNLVPSAPSSGNSLHHTIDNPMPHRLPEGENATPLEVIGTTASDKLVIIMVGLPATGA